MDAILFYGSRSDASRRQVRSAAAQHSHRIGPRKPKGSRKPKSQPDSNHTKTRSLQANTFNPGNVPTSAAVGQAGILAAAPPAPRPSTHASPTRPIFAAEPHAPVHAPTAHAITTTSSFDSQPSQASPSLVEREKELKRQAAQARFHEIQAIQAQQDAQAEQWDPKAQSHTQQRRKHYAPSQTSGSRLQLPPLQLPVAPPPGSEYVEQPRNEADSRMTGHTRTNSQSSPQSPSTRLPQYSWTEYPRYGLGVQHSQSSLQVLAQVAVAQKEDLEAQHNSPSVAHAVPGFRQYGVVDQQVQPSPPEATPLRSPQSARLDGLSRPTDRPVPATRHEPGPQLPPITVQPLTEGRPLAANATFGQFLQSAMNGHERVGDISLSSNEDNRTGNVQFSPGGG